MNEPNMEWEDEFERRFLYEEEVSGGIGLSQGTFKSKRLRQDITGLKDFISQAETRAYEKGKAECCVSKLGCLCKPSSMKCDMDTCHCPEHYGTHDEWLSSLLIHDNK